MHAIVERLLRQRGIVDFEKFFNPSLADLADPHELPGVPAAVDKMIEAVRAGRRIVVFGDYDCDGVCATAIMTLALRAIGGNVDTFLPRRLDEGYGMSDEAVIRMLGEFPGVELVVTVDNGINSISQIADLRSEGIETIVTDHHLPTVNMFGQMLLPNAVAIVNPKVAAPEHLQELCGASVAFLLANALVDAATKRGLYSGPKVGGPLLVLAGLATVTDVMPLVGQNRILVAESLKRFHTWAPLGLRELYARASRSGTAAMSTKDYGFLIGPRINAAGRVANGEESLELILTDDREIAREAARIVDGRNVERKQIESGMVEQAMTQVVEGASAQVIDLPDGPVEQQGIAGIVAARIMEKVMVPTGVLAGGHGSARAPEGYNVRDALKACAKYLTRYGGHAAAAGFSVKEGMVDEFRGAFAAECAKQKAVWLSQNAGASAACGEDESLPRYDLELSASDLTLELAEEIARMEPFGEGNKEPVFLFRGAVLSDVRFLGQESKHLAFTANGFKGVWWGRGDLVEELRASVAPVDVAFTIEISTYGEPHVELRPVEIRKI